MTTRVEALEALVLCLFGWKKERKKERQGQRNVFVGVVRGCRARLRSAGLAIARSSKRARRMGIRDSGITDELNARGAAAPKPKPTEKKNGVLRCTTLDLMMVVVQPRDSRACRYAGYLRRA